ncbi:Glucose 1-dehydrogenase 2 [Rosistilla oblonga]|uniref:SDR family NAD(P)-dependent oxidoreductase n=1 Tax=Rosistilla oblonga TaxID=2527990 RepID=UPI00118BE2CB|nr:SDR family oxidoreductase [Rosistilla oblonga]QDV15143.1 Glucose 1-dehydrogenase 2 [Rosistilla oblonga]
MSNLSGKRALISGASRGIGSAAAIELARAGADVVINYFSNADEAEATCKRCREFGVRAESIQADTGEQADCERLVAEAWDRMGGLEIVVSNAAYSDRELFYRANLDGFRRTIDVTMWGPFYLLRAASLKMIDAGTQGSIVIVSSPHAVQAMPGAMAYNMAKAAIDQMARTAAVELAQHRIRVNILHPGWIDTPGERKFFSEQTLQEKGAELPWGRLGQPQEIGRGIVFLSDPASEYVTGSTLTIDGGIQLPWRDMFRIDEKPQSV